jgi:Holliday junction resolvasome RuvABC DNA-binding subunit
MRGKRERARERAAHARGGAAAHETARAQAAAAAAHACAEVIPWLRALGFRADEARAAAARCEAIPDAPLEERVRLALSSLAPNRVRRAAPAERSSG